MPWQICKKMGAVLVLSVLSAWALGGADGYSHIAAPSVLPHSAYQVYGQMGWHRIAEPGYTGSGLPWLSGVRLGFNNNSEFAVDYGHKVSLSGKFQFMAESGWMPQWAFGVRGIFDAPEAHLHSVSNALIESYENEVFTAVGKSFSTGTSVVGGVSILPQRDQGRAQPYWGVTQYLSDNLAVVYDAFRRDASFHHNLGVHYVLREVFTLGFGVTELPRYFYQDGELGFYMRATDQQFYTGYDAPGIWFSLSLTGFMTAKAQLKSAERIAQLDAKVLGQHQRIEALEERLDRAEMQVETMRGQGPDVVAQHEKRAEELLAAVVKGFQGETWDARGNKMRQDSLLALGEPAFRLLQRVALKESSAPVYRETAIRMMGNSRQDRFVETLAQILRQDNLSIQREALLALAKIGGEKTVAQLRTLRHTVPLELKELTAEIWQALTKTTDAPSLPPLPHIP